MEPARTLSIGGATYDLFIRTGTDVLRTDAKERLLALPLGGKIRVQEILETCGGGAANTAVGLSRLGCAAHFCGVIGSDQWGSRILENLRQETVDIRCATVVEGETSSFSVVLSAGSGERVILYNPGTNVHLHDATFDRDAASTMQWLYLNRLHERGRVIVDDVVGLLSGNENIRMTWNPGGPQLEDGVDDPLNRALLSQTDLLVLNREEAQRLTHHTSLPEITDCLLRAGVRTLCVCDGANGSFAARGDQRWYCAIIREAQVIDTTGAGDAFGSGATWALIEGADLPTALRAGTLNATSVLGRIGAQAGLLTDIEMRRRLRATRLDVEDCTHSPSRYV